MRSSEILRSFSSTLLVAIIFAISCTIFLPIEANHFGFSVDLIHRDSPQSPFYNHNLSHFERLDLAFQRSMKRSQQFGMTSLIPDDGEYLMKIGYGTPAIQSFSLFDTGSELSWVQCLPCIHCYPSKSSPFNPKHSRTFQTVTRCLNRSLENNPNNNSRQPKNKPCTFELKYADKSYTRGELAKDTITVGSSPQQVKFPNFIFGCGRDNRGIFPHKGAGIVGFGPQRLSFVSQLSSLHRGKFSHCFAPATSTPGRISFGDEAIVSGPGVVSTPLIIDSHYYLMLKGVTVGTKKLKYFPDHQLHFSSNESRNMNGGRILIDSGTTFTLLLSPLQLRVDRMVRRQIKLKPAANPEEPFTLCYSSSLRNKDIPRITFHFAGANVELSPLNTFVVNSPSSRCLAIFPTKKVPIFGNLAQTNFLVGYDLVKKRVAFKQIDCTQH